VANIYLLIVKSFVMIALFFMELLKEFQPRAKMTNSQGQIDIKSGNRENYL